MKKKMDSKLFWAVKTLLMGGASYQEIIDYYGISKTTVGRVHHCETFKDYTAQLAAIAIENRKRKDAKRAAKQAELREAVKIPEPEETPAKIPEKIVFPAARIAPQDKIMLDAVLQVLKEQNEMLKLISAKMAYIVEQLT